MDALNETPQNGSDENTLKILQRYCESPLLSDQLPITLKNGFVVTELATFCPRCDANLTGEHTRGHISQVFGGILVFHSVAICRACNACILFDGRVKPEGDAFALEIIQDGKWCRYSATYPWYGKLWIWVLKQINSLSSKRND